MDECEGLEAKVRRLREAIEALEWVTIQATICPWCGSAQPGGHKATCQRQAALSETADISGMEESRR